MNSRVSPKGKAMGKNATRLAALGLQRLQAAGLADVQAPMLRAEMCKTCACQPNTVPNGCLQTQMDFLKAATEGRPFLCHAPKDGHACADATRKFDLCDSCLSKVGKAIDAAMAPPTSAEGVEHG